MAMAKYEYEKMLSAQNEDMRNKVLEGVEQTKKGKTKDFNENG